MCVCVCVCDFLDPVFGGSFTPDDVSGGLGDAQWFKTTRSTSVLSVK